MIENILIIGSKSSLAKHILEKLKDSSFKISSISRKDFNFIKNFASSKMYETSGKDRS